MKRDHYIYSNGRLKRKDNTVYFEKSESRPKALPVEKIRNLHLFGEVDLNTKVLRFLNQYGICVHVYNYYGFYSGSFYPREQQISGFSSVKQSEHYLDPHKRLFLASAFLRGGIHHMKRNLRRYKDKTLDFVHKIEAEEGTLQYCTSIPELMGKEGRIRQSYYRAFSVILPEGFVYEGRSKQPPNDPLNALISFGNSMMYRAILSEIYRTQLDPSISFLHEPSIKRFSLSLDLAEIFKPLLVDSLIFALLNRKSITLRHFNWLEGEICYLNESGQQKFLSTWEETLARSIKHRTLKRQTSYRYLIRLECYKLLKHIISDQTYKPLKAWW